MIPDDDKPFEAHGSYCFCNHGGYLIELSPCGEYARMKDAYGSDNPKISDWKEINYELEEDTQELESVIDPEGYNIPLNQVMKINI